MTTFQHPYTIRMHDTDTAGIIYFASQFRIAHEAFENLMEHEGFSFRDLFEKSETLFVIVHAESDYKAHLRLGDKIMIHVSVAHIGNSAFTMQYDLYKDDQLVGKTQTVHVCIGRQSREKQQIPDIYRNALQPYVHAE